MAGSSITKSADSADFDEFIGKSDNAALIQEIMDMRKMDKPDKECPLCGGKGFIQSVPPTLSEPDNCFCQNETWRSRNKVRPSGPPLPGRPIPADIALELRNIKMQRN